jgi:hypothetical protein
MKIRSAILELFHAFRLTDRRKTEQFQQAFYRTAKASEWNTYTPTQMFTAEFENKRIISQYDNEGR